MLKKLKVLFEKVLSIFVNGKWRKLCFSELLEKINTPDDLARKMT